MPCNSVSSHVSRLVSYEAWLKEIDKTPATGWRWRKRGWVEVVNIAGRLYISRDVIAEFEQRAAAGDFSKVHVTPSREEVRKVGEAV